MKSSCSGSRIGSIARQRGCPIALTKAYNKDTQYVQCSRSWLGHRLPLHSIWVHSMHRRKLRIANIDEARIVCRRRNNRLRIFLANAWRSETTAVGMVFKVTCGHLLPYRRCGIFFSLQKLHVSSIRLRILSTSPSDDGQHLFHVPLDLVLRCHCVVRVFFFCLSSSDTHSTRALGHLATRQRLFLRVQHIFGPVTLSMLVEYSA